MHIFNVKEKYNELKRSLEIIETLFGYGLSDIFDKSALAKKFHLSENNLNKKTETTPEKVRLALEKLGPTFVKLGQVLSTRPDILPAEYIAELEKLQDMVPPFSFNEVRKQIHLSLGDTLDNKFKSFEKEPTASASIAQVHLGTLQDDTKVAIKIKRPNIEKIINYDTQIILGLAKFIKSKSIVDDSWQITEIAEEFERSIKEELDFNNEANNLKKFTANFFRETHIKTPTIFEKYSSGDVITMEYLDGIKLNKIIDSKSNKYPKKEIAALGAGSILKQIFIDRFFHGDLHPGNLLWLENTEQLGFLDFGLVKNLKNNESTAMTAMLYGIINKDSEKIILGIEKLGIIDSDAQSSQLKNNIEDLLNKYYNADLKDIKMSVLVQEIFGLMLKYKIRLPTDLVVLAKTLTTAEGIAEKLDPDFNMFEFARPYVEEATKQQFEIKTLRREMENALLQTTRLTKSLPKDIYWILENLKNNNFQIKLEHLKLSNFTDEISIIGNRISLSLVISGLIIGSSFVMPYFRTVGLIGYVIASITGLILIISMFRRSKF